jgi:hypothetical protein
VGFGGVRSHALKTTQIERFLRVLKKIFYKTYKIFKSCPALLCLTVDVNLQLRSWESHQIWKRGGREHTGRLCSRSRKPCGQLHILNSHRNSCALILEHTSWPWFWH